MSQEANSGFPDPQILKLEHVGYMAELEINDLPARFIIKHFAVIGCSYRYLNLNHNTSYDLTSFLKQTIAEHTSTL